MVWTNAVIPNRSNIFSKYWWTQSINKHPIPFSFILASRCIQEAFDVKLLSSLTTRLVLDDKYHPDIDIQMFLWSKIQDIKNWHPSHAHLPSSCQWPLDLDEEVERLLAYLYAHSQQHSFLLIFNRSLDALRAFFVNKYGDVYDGIIMIILW